jgi:phage-related protein
MRDGELLINDVSRNNAHWQCMVHLRKNDYMARIRNIRGWLSGEGVLKISNGSNPDSFFEVLQVTHTEDIMKSSDYGRLTVDFEVYPYEFLLSGESEITNYQSITNPAEMSKPEYVIEGTGSGTLTVNGNDMDFDVETKLTIDTRRQIAKNNQNQDANDKINGEYEGLFLKSGANTISISNGFTLKVIPHWGYKI